MSRVGQLGDRWILAGVLSTTEDLLLPLRRQLSRDRNSLGTSAERSGAISEDLCSGGAPGFTFSPPTRSFLFICTLHWCKRCTGLEVAPNVCKFPLTVLVCEFAVHAEVWRPNLVGTLFSPTQALLPRSFLFTCTLHWCKRCTGQEVAQN